MSVGLLLGADDAVATQFLGPRKQLFFRYDRAIGVVRDGKIVGTVLLHGWNGANIEISYEGKGTLSPGIFKSLAAYLIHEFDLSRLTAVVTKRNRHLIRSLQKLGFKLEGVQRCHYGRDDNNRNAGVRLVAFRDRIDAVARHGNLTKDDKQCL